MPNPTCKKCGGPTIELLTSRACKAECDKRKRPKRDTLPIPNPGFGPWVEWRITGENED